MLGSLRILGRGLCFDDISESTHISERVISDFFNVFILHWSTIKFSEFVRLPRNADELAADEATYAVGGLNGCIGSADCCHVAWDRCNAHLQTLAKGKEHFPTISFQLVVNHRRRILHSSDGFLGATNDKTIARLDDYMATMRDGRMQHASNFKFKLFNSDGSETEHTGAYILTDNGYHRWRILQCPIPHPASVEESLWSKNVESFRKDVGILLVACWLLIFNRFHAFLLAECVFGVLKQRWRILKTGIRYQNHELITRIWKSACALHNYLLEVTSSLMSHTICRFSFILRHVVQRDGLDQAWAAGGPCPWEERGNELSQADTNISFANVPADQRHGLLDLSKFGLACRSDDLIFVSDTEDSRLHFALRRALIKHFMYRYSKKTISWPVR